MWRHRRSRRRRASAAVEFIVLLPVYLLIIFAMMYVGELSVFEGRTHYAGEYAMDTGGDQSEERAVRGTVTDLLYPNKVGELELTEAAPAESDMPLNGEVAEMFDEMCQAVYSTTASGRYVFDGSGLRFVVTTHQSKRLSQDGRYVAKYRLREDNIPALYTELAQGWAHRNRVDLNYAYSPDYIQIGKWPLEEVELPTTYQSAVRGTKRREVAVPPAGMNHAIDTLTGNPSMSRAGRLPHYPEFSGDEAFWEPN